MIESEGLDLPYSETFQLNGRLYHISRTTGRVRIFRWYEGGDPTSVLAALNDADVEYMVRPPANNGAWFKLKSDDDPRGTRGR